MRFMDKILTKWKMIDCEWVKDNILIVCQSYKNITDSLPVN
jgi:hypothetical protein